MSTNSFSTVTTSHGEWKRLVLALIKESDTIFILPDVTPGVRFELEQILNNYIEKTIFLMPPSYWYEVEWRTFKNGVRRTGHQVTWDQERYNVLTRRWTEVAEAFFLLRQIRVPPPSPNGCMFWYEEMKLQTCRIPALESQLIAEIRKHSGLSKRLGALSRDNRALIVSSSSWTGM